MRICFRSSHLPPEYSGAGQQALSLANALREHGVDIWFVSFCKDKELEGYGLIENFPIHRIRYDRKLPNAHRYAYGKYLKLIWHNRNLFDIFHSHGEWWFSIYLAKLLGKPVVQKITLMGVDNPSALYNFRFGKLRHYAYFLCNKIIATQDEIYNDCIKEGIPHEKIARIPNGVDLKRFYPDPLSYVEIRKKLGIALDTFIALFVGRLSIRKGLDTMLAGWEHFLNIYSGPSCLFLVGPEDNELYKNNSLNCLLHKLEEKKSVVKTGHLVDITDYFKIADVFCLPSLSEGMPNSLLEAMACGVPTIITKHKGLEFLVDSENSLLIPPGDTKALASSLYEISTNSGLKEKIGDKGRLIIEQMFDINIIAKQYVDLYEDVLSPHPKK